MKPDPDKVEVISKFKTPECKQEVQRLLGMLNYLRDFIPDMSGITSPIRDLLKKGVDWQWTANHDLAMDKIRKILSSNNVLAPFDPSLPATIQCDASKDALGACLLQNKRPVAYASRSLKKCEIEYAPIEKELLAVLFACKRFHTYIYGHQNVVTFSDHQPLVSIMTKSLDKIENNRIRRILLKLLKYQFELKYLPGKDMHVADFLSRCGIQTNTEIDETMKYVVHALDKKLQFNDDKIAKLKKEIENDDVLRKVKEFGQNGWPTVCKTAGEMNHFFKLKQEIELYEDLLYYNRRIIVPQKLRKDVLNLLHETHLGFNKMKEIAKEYYYWPCINNDLKNLVDSCGVCMRHSRLNQKDPLLSHEIPEVPFMKIAADIAEFAGRDYLVIVDYYSRWIEVCQLYRKTSSAIISKFKEIFSRFGIPRQLVSDNMPFGSFEMRSFASEWGFSITTSSPHYPKGNGLAEKAVGIVKDMLAKSKVSGKDFELFLLNYRNAPVAGLMYSPSQLLQSRTLGSKFPNSLEHLGPKIVSRNVHEEMGDNQILQENYYRGSKQVVIFKEGDRVWVQNIKSKK